MYKKKTKYDRKEKVKFPKSKQVVPSFLQLRTLCLPQVVIIKKKKKKKSMLFLRSIKIKGLRIH